MHSILEDLGLKTLSSGLECYDKLLCNGVPSDVITVDCGATTTFKTLLNLQKSFSFIKQTNSSVIIIDTEGGLLYTLAYWKERFEKRFGLKSVNIATADFNKNESSWILSKDLTDSGNLIVVTIRDIFRLFEVHGTPIDFKITEKGRIDIMRKQYTYKDGNTEKKVDEELPIELTPVGMLVGKSDVCAIIYDSLIELFKQRIPGTRENFGSRSFLLHSLMGNMQRLAETYKIPAIGTVHTSRDPADPMRVREIPNAVSTVSFNCKFMTLIQNPFFSNPMSVKIYEKRNKRVLTIWRHPGKAPLSERYTIKLTDTGLVEDEEEV